MAKFTNTHNIEPALAVWLATDEYDGVNEGNSISVTTLLKPIKEIVLGARVPAGAVSADVSTMIASRMGTALHSAIENAWLGDPMQAMKDCGYPPGMYTDLRINPKEHDEDFFNVYLEQRTSVEINGFTLNGKYDFIFDGEVQDIKSTSTYSWVHRVNDKKYALQGGLYRYLNPERVTEDTLQVHFIFTDWKKLDYIKSPKTYPPLRVMSRRFPIMNPTDAHSWLMKRLTEVRTYWDKPQDELPMCTPEDLWQGDPVYKYYKNPNNRARSNGNFSSPAEADKRRRENGGIGIVIPVYDTPKACRYCRALPICEQAQSYILSGQLKLED